MPYLTELNTRHTSRSPVVRNESYFQNSQTKISFDHLFTDLSVWAKFLILNLQSGSRLFGSAAQTKSTHYRSFNT